MAKRAFLCAMCLMILPFMGGCWNYRGLNELSIVSGITVDRDPENGQYKVCFEIVDLSANAKTSGLKAKLVESEGSTVFEAVRNAKRKLVNKLYFGNAQVLVISQQLAQQEGIHTIIGWFLRDAEVRETLEILISQEKTAQDILSIEGLDRSIVSSEIQQIISEDSSTTSSLAAKELYQVYSILHAQGQSLVLPAFHNTINDQQLVAEADGIAVFSQDKLAGFLTPEESKYYLFGTNGVHGGILALTSVEEASSGISLEISQSNTKRSFKVANGKLTFSLDIKTKAFLGETANEVASGDEQVIQRIEKAAGDMVRQKVLDVIHKVQAEYHSDIYGFGKMIYQQDPSLWAQVKESWDTWFSQLDVQVSCEVQVVNTAYIQRT